MKLDYTFKNPELLKNALTHSSYANEHRDKGVKNNERLEFLGDSVLGLICTKYIWNHYKNMPEGELTKLRSAIVCEGSLYEFALKIGLGDDLLLGKGEKSSGGGKRPSVLSDACEAVIAAVYLDGGFDEAEKFIIGFIKDKAEEIIRSHSTVDYKTLLQEIVQKNHEEILSYRLKGESGPDHDKRFEVEVLINSNVIACGEGKSKKLAEQAAAKLALELMGQ
ncbi:MAG: ribonuclease III [Clostridia bacterium]|nr:ribonuclease III [Clostridia bacterium]